MELVTPHNLEAEMAVLGSIFIDESLVTEIIDELYPEDSVSYTHLTLPTNSRV